MNTKIDKQSVNQVQEGIQKITATEWSKCVSHVFKEEEKMSKLDMLIDNKYQRHNS